MRRLLVALFSAVLVAGCTSSAAPKFPYASGLPLMGDGGRLAIYHKTGDGRFDRKDVLTVDRLPDGRYRVRDNDDTIVFTLHRVAGYVVIQAKSDNKSDKKSDDKSDKSIDYEYSFARLVGGELHQLKLDWAAQDRQRLTALGVTGITSYSGNIDHVTDMTAFVAALKFGEVDQKYVRE